MPTFKVVTINILNDLSRWDERRLLLVDGLAELDPDLIGLQEVVLPDNNAQWLADQLNLKADSTRRPYRVHLCPKTGKKATKEGIAILSRLPVEREATLDLRTQQRVAQLVQVRVDGQPVVFVNGHYYWRPSDSPERVQQIRLLLEWLERLPHETAIVAGGDFNGTPESKAIQLMRERFTSAYAARHGGEPDYTCPTPLVRPGFIRGLALLLLNLKANRRLRPWRGTLDYLFVNERLRVTDCQVVLNRPAPHDARLYPSDHFGLAATLEIKSNHG